MPPAFSQSDFVVYFEKSLEVPDGLAEGELEEPPDAPGMVVEPLPEVPEPVPPEVPEGLLEPELPFVPLPLPVWAATIAGARAMIPTKSVTISFCMAIPSCC
jgi:hypothetical protein